MAYLLVHFKVEDYERWKQVFDEAGTARREHGSRGARVLRSADDPNEIVVMSEWDDVEQVRRWTQSSVLREAVQRAGLLGPADVYILDEVERQPA